MILYLKIHEIIRLKYFGKMARDKIEVRQNTTSH